MEIAHTIVELDSILGGLRKQQKTIGFVPTMGALHDGHMHLIAQCIKETEVCVASIFVNPLQFNDPADLSKYPKTPESDVQKLKEAGCHVLFCPTSEEMYPLKPKTSIGLGPIAEILEGKYRPKHLNGVALVIIKLFNVVQPDFAFFGQKDLQQCYVVRQLVNELSFQIQLRMVETAREPDGLAMSSRNVLLSPNERKNAGILFESLQLAVSLAPFQSLDRVKKNVRKNLKSKGFNVEYLELVSLPQFEIAKQVLPKQSHAFCLAGTFHKVRLIDNIIFNT